MKNVDQNVNIDSEAKNNINSSSKIVNKSKKFILSFLAGSKPLLPLDLSTTLTFMPVSSCGDHLVT